MYSVIFSDFPIVYQIYFVSLNFEKNSESIYFQGYLCDVFSLPNTCFCFAEKTIRFIKARYIFVLHFVLYLMRYKNKVSCFDFVQKSMRGSSCSQFGRLCKRQTHYTLDAYHNTDQDRLPAGHSLVDEVGNLLDNMTWNYC